MTVLLVGRFDAVGRRSILFRALRIAQLVLGHGAGAVNVGRFAPLRNRLVVVLNRPLMLAERFVSLSALIVTVGGRLRLDGFAQFLDRLLRVATLVIDGASLVVRRRQIGIQLQRLVKIGQRRLNLPQKVVRDAALQICFGQLGMMLTARSKRTIASR
jgi:hypothetical protein